MSIITLTTDYGLKDHHVGSLKGKILNYLPTASIVDISHNISAFNVIETTYIINNAYKNFPEGSIHIIGVDSERLTEDGHIVMKWKGHYFICADNGILSIFTNQFAAEAIYAINIHNRISEKPTDINIFAMVATHLAKNGAPSVIGKEIPSLKKELKHYTAEYNPETKTLIGHILYIDHYGNGISNIRQDFFHECCQNRNFKIQINRFTFSKIYPRYVDFALKSTAGEFSYIGEKLAIFNDDDFLEIAIYRGNNISGTASSLLGLEQLNNITITFE